MRYMIPAPATRPAAVRARIPAYRRTVFIKCSWLVARSESRLAKHTPIAISIPELFGNETYRIYAASGSLLSDAVKVCVGAPGVDQLWFTFRLPAPLLASGGKCTNWPPQCP